MVLLCIPRYLPYLILNKTWNVNRNSKRSALDLTYKIHGLKPSETSKQIVVLHGLLGSKRNWNGVSSKIASTHNACVVAADARNHGDSPHDSSHTYFDLASDVSQLITKLSMKKVHVIGHSMGGRTAMTLALTEPSKVGSLVIVDISPVSSISITNDFFTRLVDILKTVDFQGADNIVKAKKLATDKIAASGLVDDMQGMHFVIMNIGQLADKSFGWKINLDALRNHFTTIASFPKELSGKQYTGPAIFIGGGSSDHIPKSDEPKIKTFFPNSELTYVANVGHNVHAENPTAFLQIVNNFLSKNL